MTVPGPGGVGFRRQWRYYRTEAGAMPARDFLASLDVDDAKAIRAGMRIVAESGRSAARHVRGDIYEVRVRRSGRAWRVLFSTEGRFAHVLLAVSAFEKKTSRTPKAEIDLAEARLRDWRRRGQ